MLPVDRISCVRSACDDSQSQSGRWQHVMRICATLLVLAYGSLSPAAEPVRFPQSHVVIPPRWSVSPPLEPGQHQRANQFHNGRAIAHRIPPVMPAGFVNDGGQTDDSWQDCCCFDVGYQDGIFAEVNDEEGRSFSLKLNGRIQFRYAGFSRDATSYSDNAGVTIPVRNRSRFDIERARLIFSGHMLDEKWKYFIQLDGDTDRGSRVVFFDYWWAYQFGDPLEIRVGKAKVPGTRQWLLSAFDTRMVDRPLATEFFRPDRTQGIWAVGKLGECTHYQAMIGNGYRTANLSPQEVNDKFAAATSFYWDPLGDYGSQLIDFENHDQIVMRLGSSLVYASQSGFGNMNTPILESQFARLSDGTVLTSTGALAPGVTVDAYDIFLLTFDFAAKYRGWSFDAEYYLRWIDGLRADAALPINDLFQHGFFVEGGFFLVPQTLDFNMRYSQVSGDFGTSTEYAAGFNYFPCQTTNVKMSFDVTWLDGAPTSSTGADIIVGDDGTLFRAQFQALF